MKYRITAIWDEELHEENDIVRAREAFELDLRDSMDHMEFENLRVDLQEIRPAARVATIIPHTHGAEIESAVFDGEGGQTYPDDAPPHPWDQGLWIFPEDHPLSAYERQAARAPTLGAKEAFLEAGRKALPPPLEDE